MARIRTPWRGVAALFALNGVTMGTWAGRIPALVEHWALSEARLGVLLLLLGLGSLVAFPFAGVLADRIGALRVARGAMALVLVALIAVGQAPGLPWLALAIFVLGLTHGATNVTMNAWAGEVERQLARPVMSSFHGMWSLGAGLGALGSFLAVRADLAPGPHFVLVPLLATALLGPFVMLRWEGAPAPQRKGPVFALPRGPLILIGLIALAAGLGEGTVTDWGAVYLADNVGASEARAALGYAVFSVSMVAGRLGAGAVIGRLGRGRVARLGALLAAAGAALVVWAPGVPVVLAGFLAMGLGYAALIPLVFSRAADDPVIPPGQAIAAVATLGYGSMLLGPPFIGLVAHLSSLRLAFALVALSTLAIAALAPLLDSRDGRDGRDGRR